MDTGAHDEGQSGTNRGCLTELGDIYNLVTGAIKYISQLNEKVPRDEDGSDLLRLIT